MNYECSSYQLQLLRSLFHHQISANKSKGIETPNPPPNCQPFSASSPGISPYQIVPFIDGTLEEFFNALEGSKKQGWCSEEVTKDEGNLLRLTEQGIQVLNATSRDSLFTSCDDCIAKGFNLKDQEVKSFLDRYLEVIDGRPPPKEEYDQTFVTSFDIVLRVAFMQLHGDLLGREFLFIGDADMLGLAIALTGLAKKVFVLDVDERVVNFINQKGKEYNLPISARVNDVRNPFPKDCIGMYDVFVTDPVETVEGIKLFFSHGVTGLRGPGSLCYFGLTTDEASRKKWHAIEKQLMLMNFLVTDIRRNFSEYDCTHFDDLWPICKRLGLNPKMHRFYWSALLRCEAIDTPKALIDVSVGRDLTEDIYRDDEAWGTPEL